MAEPILQWKRECELFIGDPKKGTKYLAVQDGVNGVAGLRIAFKVTKTIGSDPNVAEVKIYNLHPDNEGKVKGSGQELIINAGYRGHSQLIFAGNIRRAFRTREDNDWIMNLHAGDGDNDLRDTIINRSFKAGHTHGQVLDEIVKGMTTTSLGYTKLNGEKTTRGVVYTGMARHHIDRIARQNDANWSVQNRKLVIVPVDSTLPDEAVVINSETGMLGTPELDDKGVKVRCLMNPQLKINGKVKLDENSIKEKLLQKRGFQPGSTAKKTPSKTKTKTLARLDPDGVYKVYKLIDQGDTRSELWESESWCVDLDKPIPTGKGAA